MAETETILPERIALPPEAEREIENFEAETARFLAGELSPERYRAFRLAQGIYGQRQPGVQMVRVKIPTGALTGRQLHRLADISERYSTGVCHLTTRQDMQFHFVQLADIPQVMRLLAEAGLTTREACGNSVRNVTACPLTGFIAEELFDVQPYAIATFAFLVRNPFCQQMARKFKIAFSSCPEDCAATAIHDIGAVGRVIEQDGRSRYGFKILVGGGLGSTPFTAQVLDEFVPIENLLATVKGILKVFADHGNRRNKMKARLKFVVHRQGIEAFRVDVARAVAGMTGQERAETALLQYLPASFSSLVAGHLEGRPSLVEIRTSQALAAVRPAVWVAPPSANVSSVLPLMEQSSLAGSVGPSQTAPPPRPSPSAHSPADRMRMRPGKGFPSMCDPVQDDTAFHRWQSCSVRPHKDHEHVVVTVMFPLGDMEAGRLRALSKLVTRYGEDQARVARDQNLVLPSVKRADLRPLYEGLAETGVAEAGVGTALDITACPGADTCGLGITSSKGLTRSLQSELQSLAGNGGLEAMRGVTIKISGCPNSCGQHHIANIGLHGVVKNIGGRQVPSYQLHLGGRVDHGEARIGDPLEKIPAKQVPKVVAALLELFRKERRGNESFAAFAARLPRERIQALLSPILEQPPPLEHLAVDWGQEGPFSTEEIGRGECAGAGTDAAVAPFDNYEAEIRQALLFMERGEWVDALANLNRSQYTLARILLERLGKVPESDYETTCEIRAQVIDRGHASEGWNEIHEEIEALLRTRWPDPASVRQIYDRTAGLLEESRRTLALLDRKKSAGAADIPG